MDATIGFDDPLDEAFAAFLHFQENGQADAARQMLRDQPGLAERVAMFYALCARVPQPWESSVNSYAGRAIGDFELLHELDRGAEGEVYKARQNPLKRYVAVKVMRRERFSQESEKQRFIRTSTLLASLHHPNIVEIYSAGESETGVPYFAMELMQESFKQKLANGWLPTPQQAAELTRALAQGVQCAHGKGIVHRDLKPANILLDADGTPKIVDFGLGKQLAAGNTITQPGAIVGTLSYMAPEQANGQPADLPCDIYGLGAMLYELLTGRPPFVGADPLDTLEQVRHHAPIPVRHLSPSVPRDLEAVCLKCLEKEPAKRYPSAEELAADLQRFIRGEPVRARLPGMWGRAVRTLLRHQFANVTVWGWPTLVGGIIIAIGNLVEQWVIWSGQPEWVWWGVAMAITFLFAIPYWTTLRHRQFGVGDRQALAVVMASLATMCLLPAFFYRPYDGMNLTAYLLSLYPIYALINGTSTFIMGAIFWGGFYLSALGYVLLALLMQLIPEWSPLLLGTYNGASHILVGSYFLRLGKSPEFRN
jgi:tRNA A-37 threonylcarbamoyl transferase component Bud32